VVVKQIPAQSVLSVRTTIDTLKVFMMLSKQILEVLPFKHPYGLFMVIWHNGGFFEQNSDIEICRLLDAKLHPPVPLTGDLQMCYRELPAVETMATYVVKGPGEHIPIGFGAIGTWAEVNHYRFVGGPRIIIINIPQAADGSDSIFEIQYPVEAIR